MKGSIIVLLFFVAGCILGLTEWLPFDMKQSNLTLYILYALMLQVGLSIGSSKELKHIIADLRLKYLLIPLATICGTLLFPHLPVYCFHAGVYSTVWRWAVDLPTIRSRLF